MHTHTYTRKRRVGEREQGRQGGKEEGEGAETFLNVFSCVKIWASGIMASGGWDILVRMLSFFFLFFFPLERT